MQKSFEVTGPVRLDVHLSSGLIEIEPTLDGHVEVELIAHDAESQQLVDAARVELRGSGERLEVVVDVPARPKSWSLGNLLGRQTISCRIQCPAGSDLKARSKSADIRVRGTLGEVDVATASGDVVIVDTLGDVSIKSASGDLSAGSVGGRATANTASGDVRIESVAGAVVANTASGDVEINSAGSDVRANTASGDTSIGAVIERLGRGQRRIRRRTHRRPPRVEGSPRLLHRQWRRPLGARARHRRARRRRPVRRGEGTYSKR